MLSVAGTAQQKTVKSDISIRLGTISGTKIDFSGISDALAGPNDKLNADINLGSYNADIIGRYYLSDQLAKRFALGISSLNYKLETKRTYPSTEMDMTEASLKQTKINLTPAIERHFKKQPD